MNFLSGKRAIVGQEWTDSIRRLLQLAAFPGWEFGPICNNLPCKTVIDVLTFAPVQATEPLPHFCYLSFTFHLCSTYDVSLLLPSVLH